MELVIIVLAIVFLLLILLGLAIVNYSYDDLVQKYNQVSKHITGITPNELANEINNIHFADQIKIKYKDQMFSDSYNSSGVLTLSHKYANDNNVAALSICAHELGHAFQFKNEKTRMKKHAKLLSFSKNASKLASPFFIGGIIALIFSKLYLGVFFISLSAVCVICAIVIKMATLKIENDASQKALDLLKTYACFTDEELLFAKQFLNSAKQTYIADVIKIMLKWTMLIKK